MPGQGRCWHGALVHDVAWPSEADEGRQQCPGWEPGSVWLGQQAWDLGPVRPWACRHGLRRCWGPHSNLTMLRHFSSEFKVSQGGQWAPEGCLRWEEGKVEEASRARRRSTPYPELIGSEKAKLGVCCKGTGSLGLSTGHMWDSLMLSQG